MPAIVAGLTVIVGFVGCAYVLPSAEVTVVLPALPDAWREQYEPHGFTLTLIDPDGSAASMELPPGLDTVELSVRKDGVSVVIAQPDGECDFCHPAGALFPVSVDEQGRLPVTWQGGASASVLGRVARAGFPLDSVNISKLMRRMEEVSLSEDQLQIADGWNLDLGRIVDAVCRGSLASTQIRRLESAPVRVRLPASSPSPVSSDPLSGWNGDLLTDDALRPELHARFDATTRAAELGALTVGTHRFVSRDGGFRLDIELAANGRVGWRYARR